MRIYICSLPKKSQLTSWELTRFWLLRKLKQQFQPRFASDQSATSYPHPQSKIGAKSIPYIYSRRHKLEIHQLRSWPDQPILCQGCVICAISFIYGARTFHDCYTAQEDEACCVVANTQVVRWHLRGSGNLNRCKAAWPSFYERFFYNWAFQLSFSQSSLSQTSLSQPSFYNEAFPKRISHDQVSTTKFLTIKTSDEEEWRKEKDWWDKASHILVSPRSDWDFFGQENQKNVSHFWATRVVPLLQLLVSSYTQSWWSLNLSFHAMIKYHNEKRLLAKCVDAFRRGGFGVMKNTQEHEKVWCKRLGVKSIFLIYNTFFHIPFNVYIQPFGYERPYNQTFRHDWE